MQGYKFQGDIACYTHILNIIIQDILKALIKNILAEDQRFCIINGSKM
jgi:hypothetical protein